jgi:hypothetical protein
MVYTQVLEACARWLEGSSPSSRTKLKSDDGESHRRFVIFNCMNSRTLRLLIREILLREAQNPVSEPKAKLRTSIEPYHAAALADIPSLCTSYFDNIKEVGGVVVAYSAGKKIYSTSIGANSMLPSAGDIHQATAKMEQTLRAAIKNNALIYKDAAKWRANILTKRGADGKPFLANEQSAKYLELYEKSEIEAMPIVFIVASPDATSSARLAALEKCMRKKSVDRVYAFYRSDYGAYVVNLVTDHGFLTLKPAVVSNKTEKPASPALKSKILTSLKIALSNPSSNGFVAAHEFAHAESRIFSYFFDTLAKSRPENSSFSTAGADEGAMNTARLADLKSAIEVTSSDLISAKNEAEINAAVLNHDPSLKVGTADHFGRILQYATVLGSLGIKSEIARVFPLEYAKETGNTTSQGFQNFEVGPINIGARSKEAIIAFAEGLNLDSLSSEHLTVTLKMLQQYSPNLGDVGAAIQALNAGGISSEEARRANVILQLAGAGGLRNSVMRFAANDPVQQKPGAPSQPASSATA